MTMGEAGECSYAATDSAVHYVAGRLSESAAEAFEEHLFTCDRCSDEVRLGLEIKAAASSRSHGSAGPAVRGALWRPLAVAAALAVAVLGAWQLQRSKGLASGGVTRGEDARVLAVQAHSDAAGVDVSWAPVARADVYRVEVSSADGALLLKREGPESSLRVRRDDLAASADSAVYVRVTALDSLRQEIASSPPVSINPASRRD